MARYCKRSWYRSDEGGDRGLTGIGRRLLDSLKCPLIQSSAVSPGLAVRGHLQCSEIPSRRMWQWLKRDLIFPFQLENFPGFLCSGDFQAQAFYDLAHSSNLSCVRFCHVPGAIPEAVF